jgi:hypothetical protein
MNYNQLSIDPFYQLILTYNLQYGSKYLYNYKYNDSNLVSYLPDFPTYSIDYNNY